MPCQCGEHNTRRLCEAFRNPQTEQEAVLNKLWQQSTNALQQNRWNNLQTLDGALKQTGEKFRQQLDDMVKAVGEAGTDTANGMLRLQSLVADIKSMCKDAGLTVSSQTENMLTSIYDESQKRAAWMLDGATPGNVSINFDLVPKDQIMSMLGQNFEGGMFSKRIFEISDKMATDIQTSLTQGMLTGSSIKDMADKVYDIFGDEHSGYYYRATLIARTETIRAREMARDRMFKQNKDIIADELWVGMESECDQCADIEAQHNEGGNRDLQPVIDTHPNCFLHHSVSITTDKGMKQIGKIQIGDNVLTHLGRFRKVKAISQTKERYFGDAVCIVFKGREKTKGRSLDRNSLVTTPEHPYLTQDGWKIAKDITENDKLFVLAKQCRCGELIPYWKTYCSMECQLTNEIRSKISSAKKGSKNAMWGKYGPLNPAWNGGTLHRYVSQWATIRENVLMRDGYCCQSCGKTEEEHQKQHGCGLHVHHISPYRQSNDSGLDNLVTLCTSCHRKIEGTNSVKVLESGGALFIAVPVLSVKHLSDFEGEKRYNFEVEEDNSYVAKGIVVHNCVCTKIAVLKPWDELADGSGEQPGDPQDFEDFKDKLENGTLPRLQDEPEQLPVDYKLEYDTKTGKMKRVQL